MRAHVVTLAEIDILSFAAQAAMAERYQRTRDARVAAALLTANRSLLAAIVRRVARDGIDSAGLMAAGETGLRDAIAQFTPAFGVAFPTYATWLIHERVDSQARAALSA